jgi:hypothetical protein
MARVNPRSHFVTWYATSGTKYVKVASLAHDTVLVVAEVGGAQPGAPSLS